MKKPFYRLMAAAALLWAASACSNEQETVSSGNGEKGTEVTFQLALEDTTVSRAADHYADDDTYSKASRVDNVIAEVYNSRTKRLVARSDENAIKDLRATVRFRLVSGIEYDFVFWAEKKGNGFYDTSDLREIKVSYAGNANDEDRDAFTAKETNLYVRSSSINKDVYLKRPFAQLNIASTDEEHRIAEGANFACKDLKSVIRIKGLHDTYDALTEEISGSVDTALEYDYVPGKHGEVLKNVIVPGSSQASDFEGYLSMNYFLAKKKEVGQTIDLEAEFDSQVSTDDKVANVKVSISNVPVARNHRTNIIGNILTEQSVFKIIIDNRFNDQDHNVPIKDNKGS